MKIQKELRLFSCLAKRHGYRCYNNFKVNLSANQLPYEENFSEHVFVDAAFWKMFSYKLPLLSLANRIVLNIPATSICVERFFSIASNIHSKKNIKLGSKLCEQLYVLKAASNHLSLEKIDITQCPMSAALQLSKVSK